MSWWSRLKYKPKIRKLRRLIERHLGIDLVQTQSVAHEIKPAERVNLQLIVDRWAAASRPAAQEFRFSSTSYYADDGVVKYLITDELIQAPMERMQFDSGPGQTLDCIVRGLCLLWHNGVPVVLAFRGGHGGGEPDLHRGAVAQGCAAGDGAR